MRRTIIALVVFVGWGFGGALHATPDVNLDQALDVVDVQATVNLILSQSQSEWAGQGDVNKDQTVDVVDVQMLVNEILGVSAAALSIPDPGPVLTVSAGIPWSRRVFALGGGSATRTFTLAVGAPAWLTVSTNGTLQGTPPGVGQFPFLLQVGNGAQTTSLALAVAVTNLAPTVENEVVYVFAGSTYTSSSSGVLANDSDPDGHSLSAVSVMNPLAGTATLFPNGQLIYQIPADAEGIEGLVYEARDGFGGATRGSVKIIILPQGDQSEHSEAIVFPGIVKSGNSVRVTSAFRLTGNSTLSSVTAHIESTASVVNMTPRSTGVSTPGSELWSGELNTAGVSPGVHRVVILASSGGSTPIVRNMRIVIHQGDPFHVGPGAYSSVANARTASGPDDAIIIAPGSYLQSTGGVTALFPNTGGIIGCSHGCHAIRLTAESQNVASLSTGHAMTGYGLTIVQGTNRCFVLPSLSNVTLVGMRFIGLALTTASSYRWPAIVQTGGTLVVDDCAFLKWTRNEGLENYYGAAVSMVGGTATLKDSSFIGVVAVGESSTYSSGGAVSVARPYGTVTGATLNVSGCRFVDCSNQDSIQFFGGAIGVSWAKAYISDTEFVRCMCKAPHPLSPSIGSLFIASGGAVAARFGGVVDIYRCRFIDNGVWAVNPTHPSEIAALGGALSATQFSSMVVDQCEFEGNWLWQGNGEAAKVSGSVAVVQRESALRLENCIFKNNAPYGPNSLPAALFCVGGREMTFQGQEAVASRLTLFNCLALGNRGGITSHFISVEDEWPTVENAEPLVKVSFCTVAGAKPAIEDEALGGSTITAAYGALTAHDNVFWLPTVSAVTWTGGGSATLAHSAIGPMAVTGIGTAIGNLTADPMLDLPGTGLLLPGSPCINAGSAVSQSFGLSTKAAVSSLTPDSGQADMGYHAPLATTVVAPFTAVNAYLQGHQMGLHAAYANPPSP